MIYFWAVAAYLILLNKKNKILRSSFFIIHNKIIDY